MQGERIAFVGRAIATRAPALPPWHYEAPTPERPATWLPGDRFEMEAWVLPQPGLSPVRLASSVDGLTRIHDPTVSRLDVVRKLLDPASGAELATCGYRLVLPLPVSGQWRIGLERDGIIQWLMQLERAGQ
jgi:hypothetical protein